MRLPRDWLGPRDELIPFGSAADHSPGAVLHDSDGSFDDAEPESPQAADDFWGENSHSLHHALQGPAPEPDWQREQAATARRAPQFPHGLRRFNLPRPRSVAAGAALATAALALVGLAAGALSSGGSPPSSVASRSAGLLAGLSTGATVGVHVAQALHGAEAAVRVGHRADRLRVRESHARTATRHQVPRHIHVHAAASQSSSGQSGAAQSTPTYPATPAGSSSTVSSAAGTARNETGPTAVNASASHSSSTSPTGASGALGPVQSPNG